MLSSRTNCPRGLVTGIAVPLSVAAPAWELPATRTLYGSVWAGRREPRHKWRGSVEDGEDRAGSGKVLRVPLSDELAAPRYLRSRFG